jgi:hypothetical protein
VETNLEIILCELRVSFFLFLTRTEQMGILGQILEDFDVKNNHYKDSDAKKLTKIITSPLRQ